MGCDIHCWLEYREAADKDWTLQKRSPCFSCDGTGKDRHDKSGKCWRCDGSGFTELETEHDSYVEDGKTIEYTRLTGGDCYHDRNYVLFTLLAGVRHCIDDYEVMFEPRGVPADATPEFKQLSEEMGSAGHSHSWLTLSEIESIVYTASMPMVDDELTEVIKNHVAGEFWDGLVKQQMRPIAEKYGSENVRIVFFFDN